MANKPGALNGVLKALGEQLKRSLISCLTPKGDEVHNQASPRREVVEKVSRNALSELVTKAQTHPQKGEPDSANPAFVALAELAQLSRRPGLALGLRHETGEITFLDFDLNPEIVKQQGGAYVPQAENLVLWRHLEELIYSKVDNTMLGPRKPIRPPSYQWPTEEVKK